mmetsp:Transcript_19576/g.30119  ORF Transcript_19576/g.30119 Transcript_19576/m.30119 type:complete len:189 (+) Transcript_19576:1871-2437(+)
MDIYPSQGLRFFQASNIELEGLYGSTLLEDRNSVEGYLDKNFPYNLMLKGFPSWNVPLSHSVNAMPPSKHTDPLNPSAELGKESMTVKQVSQNAMILSAVDTSVNLWGTQAGLTKLGAFNFKAQANIDPDGQLSRAKLHFLSFNQTPIEGGATIYSVFKQKAKGSQMEEGDVMRALYDEDEADVDDSS